MGMNRICMYFAEELKRLGLYEKMADLNVYVGDIHNHCGISYGYGSIENAVEFARSQLDFFSVTGHFAWPDMERDGNKCIPPDVIAYHKEGFERLRRNWPHYRSVMAESESEKLVPFLSYEYHSFEYGDYTVLCRSMDEDLPARVPENARDERLANLLNGNSSQTERFLATPHHIGYKTGYRGINWKLFNEKTSPLVEIVSMHGCAESEEARPLYLHTMGPRSMHNTYQGGLLEGHHFGVVGSTDHHNAAPGSYGSGRTVLFLRKLDRDSVWNELVKRRTAAASGDPIQTLLLVNGHEAGEIAPEHDGTVEIEAFAAGYDMFEKMEIIQDGRVIAARYDFESEDCPAGALEGFVSLRFGWGKKHMPAVWDVRITVSDGDIISCLPRFRGIDMVDPLDVPSDCGSVIPSIKQENGGVNLHVVTDGNATAQTDSTQGVALEVSGTSETVICIDADIVWNGEKLNKQYRIPLPQLLEGQVTEYVNGFVSPAIEAGKFRSRHQCMAHISSKVRTDSRGAVYMRVYEKNGDAVFTSPVSFR